MRLAVAGRLDYAIVAVFVFVVVFLEIISMPVERPPPPGLAASVYSCWFTASVDLEGHVPLLR